MQIQASQVVNGILFPCKYVRQIGFSGKESATMRQLTHRPTRALAS